MSEERLIDGTKYVVEEIAGKGACLVPVREAFEITAEDGGRIFRSEFGELRLLAHQKGSCPKWLGTFYFFKGRPHLAMRGMPAERLSKNYYGSVWRDDLDLRDLYS